MLKKNKIIIVTGISSVVLVSSIIIGMLTYFNFSSKAPENTLIFGCTFEPVSIDPHDLQRSSDYYVVDQVAEGLVRYKHSLGSIPKNDVVPNLAKNWTISSDGLNYTFNLVQNTTFHDGRSFNATWVKKSFDRLQYFLNATGELTNPLDFSGDRALYEWPDGTLIMNKTEVISEYVAKVVLNRPYAPFIHLLCYSSSSIFIPLNKPEYRGGIEIWKDYMDIRESDIYGTGPWVYDGYKPEVSVSFHANPEYWRGASNIEFLKFKLLEYYQYSNYHDALLAGAVHFLDSPSSNILGTLEANPDINLVPKGPVTSIYCIGMNNRLINVTWRKAISYVIDYEYVAEDLREFWGLNPLVRAESPIPLGITYANWSHSEANLNITKARTIMQSMGFGRDEYGPWGINPDMNDDGVLDDPTNSSTNNYNWTTAAQNTPFRIINCTFRPTSGYSENIFYMVIEQLKLIGVKTVVDYVSWTELAYRCFEYSGYTRDMLEIYEPIGLGGGFYYNDPGLVNRNLTNKSVSYNSAQYNGYLAAIEDGRNPLNLWDNVQLLMEAALSELNPTTRKAMYDRIQYLLVERDMPWVFGWSYISYVAHHKNLKGYPYNNLGRIYFYPCSFNKSSSV